MVRPSYDAAVDAVNHASAALSTLRDESAVPRRVTLLAGMIDAAVGSAVTRLTAVRTEGADPDNAVAAVAGAIKANASALSDLLSMPEAQPWRAELDELSAALAPFLTSLPARRAA